MRIFGHKPRVSFKQLCFVSYAGMIRGAIAFGLVLRVGKEGLIKSEDDI